MKFYTGIGARKTPENILSEMYFTSGNLNYNGWTLRSGKADGADRAFQLGVEDSYGQKDNLSAAEVYVPWKGFTSGKGLSSTWDIHDWPDECFQIDSEIHPAWDKCSRGAKATHARNICQVLGKDLATPSKFVLYWAPEKVGESLAEGHEQQ